MRVPQLRFLLRASVQLLIGKCELNSRPRLDQRHATQPRSDELASAVGRAHYRHSPGANFAGSVAAAAGNPRAVDAVFVALPQPQSMEPEVPTFSATSNPTGFPPALMNGVSVSVEAAGTEMASLL
jgi:hypothetical protein